VGDWNKYQILHFITDIQNSTAVNCCVLLVPSSCYGDPCHHGSECPGVAGGGYGLQIRRVAANILNKQSRTADKGGPPTSGLGEELRTARHRDGALVNKVMNIRVPKETENFLNSCSTISFSRRTLLHGVSWFFNHQMFVSILNFVRNCFLLTLWTVQCRGYHTVLEAHGLEDILAMEFLWFSSVPPDKCWDKTLI